MYDDIVLTALFFHSSLLLKVSNENVPNKNIKESLEKIRNEWINDLMKGDGGG